MGRKYFILFSIPFVLEMMSVCVFKFRYLFTTRKLKSFTYSMSVSSMFREIAFTSFLDLWNIMYLVFFTFMDNLFKFSHSLILSSSPLMVSLIGLLFLKQLRVLDKVVSSA